MTRIDHAAKANNLLRSVASEPMTSAEATVSMMAAQTHATLALVEQQRIANLIALSHPQALGTDGVTVRIALYDDDGTLRFDIGTALGIEVAS